MTYNVFSGTLNPTHSLWSTCYQKDKILIERVQHRFTRMIPGFSKLPYHERLEHLGLWSLEERRNRADIIEVFKMTEGLVCNSSGICV